MNKQSSISIEDALGTLNNVEVPHVAEERQVNARTKFLAESRAMAVQAVTPTSPERHSLWKDVLTNFQSVNFREVSMKTMVKIIMVLAVLFAGTAGTVSASQDSLPGSPLYALKTSLENWQLNRANSPEKTAEVALAISENRVEEAIALANKGEVVPAQVAQSYGENVNTAFKAMGELDEPAQNQLREKIAKEIGEQVQEMQQAQVKNNGDDCQLQNMFQTMEQAGNMVQEGNANQYAGEDTPGVTTKCQGDECEQVGPNAGNGNGPGEPNGPANDACEPNGPNNGDSGNEDPAQIQDGNNGGQNQGDIGNVHGNGNDNDNPGGSDNQGGQNGGDNGNGDGNGNNGGSGGNGGGNGGGN